MHNVDSAAEMDFEFDFEVLETNEATAFEEMGASTSGATGGSCCAMTRAAMTVVPRD